MNIKDFKRSDAMRVMNWCKRNVGLNYRRKYFPMLEWHNKSYDGDCGDYDFEENKITIYKSAHRSALDIIHTIIHEWQHYLQSTKKYYEYADKYSYQNNPFEKQANYIAEKNKFKCKKDLFK
jgi:Zn-dependent peptidase ImmA (M78 family)